MTRKERVRYEMFSRVRQFGNTHGQKFEKTSIGGKAFAAVAAAVAEMEDHAKAKVRTSDDGKEAKALAREAIVEQLTDVARTARLVSTKVSGGAAKAFKVLRWKSDAGLLTAARAVIDDGRAGHLYARECCANTWYAIGACHLRRGDRSVARAAFEQAIARVSAHPMARAGLWITAGLKTGGSIAQMTGGSIAQMTGGFLDHTTGGSIDRTTGSSIDKVGAADLQVGRALSLDHALASAAWLVASSDAPAAAAIVDAAVASALPGNAGWTLPVEPLLDVQRNRAIWERALTRVRMRAE